MAFTYQTKNLDSVTVPYYRPVCLIDALIKQSGLTLKFWIKRTNSSIVYLCVKVAYQAIVGRLWTHSVF